jgi:outer membrane protease
MRFGDTRFKLDFNYLLPDSSLGSGGSELVFPLDVTQAGLQFGFRVMRAGHRIWTADLRLLFAVSNPGSKMTDKDWDNTDLTRVEWSSTESTVDGSLSELEFETTSTLVTGRTAELAVLAGVTFQKVKQRLTDLSGWQLGVDGEGDPVVYLVEDNELAGTYEIRYVRPQIGVVPRFLWGPVTAELKGVVSPLLVARDIDDHVRRYFQIRTDGKGFGYGGRAALQYESRSKAKIRPFGRLSGEISRARVEVSGYREYYADNADDGAERGDRYAEEHIVSSTQYGVNLAVGIRF